MGFVFVVVVFFLFLKDTNKQTKKKAKASFSCRIGGIAPKLAHICCMFLAEEQIGEEVVTGAVCHGGFGGVEGS